MRIEEVTIGCNGNKLFAELYISDRTSAPGIIVCHGMNKQGFHALPLYRRFAEAASREGFNVLIFDFRGCGKSTGEFGYGVKEQEDLGCIIDYLVSRREVDRERIYLVGHSLGGAIALYTSISDSRVKGVALWSTPANHAYNVKKFIQLNHGKLGYYLFLLVSYIDEVVDISKLFNMRVYGILLRPSMVRKKLMGLNECEAVSNLKIPVLIVIGDSDKVVGVEEAKDVFSAANNPKKFVLIKGANHIYEGKEEKVIFETLQWLKSLG